MKPKIEEKWSLPPKEYAGEDMRRLFALMLLDTLSSNLMVPLVMRNPDLDINEVPICSGLPIFLAEREEILQRLKAAGAYHYDRGGSIQFDLDLKVEEKYPTEEFQKIFSLFNTGMSTEQAFQLSQNIVNDWEWRDS